MDPMANIQRQSILCPNCKKLISVSESRCPFCGTTRPGSWWKNNPWTRGFRDAHQFVKTLISASFLHGGILHIFFNMAALRQLAAVVNREYGVYRMFIIYTLSGIVGFLISYLAGVAFTIGASASVCGLVGALLYYGKSRGGIYGRNLYRQISVWVIFLFVFGLVVPGINNWGHGGGILAGIIFGFLLGYQEKKREKIIDKILAGGCALTTLAVLIWAIGSSVYYMLTA